MEKEIIILYKWICPACGCKNKTSRKGKGWCVACRLNAENYDFCECGHVIETKGKSKLTKCSACLTTGA